MWVADGNCVCQAVGFKMAGYFQQPAQGEFIDIVYTCGINTYKGIKSIELQLKDIRISTLKPDCISGVVLN